MVLLGLGSLVAAMSIAARINVSAAAQRVKTRFVARATILTVTITTLRQALLIRSMNQVQSTLLIRWAAHKPVWVAIV